MVEPTPITDAGLAELERALSAVPSPGLWLPWQLSRFDTSRITGSDGALMAEIYWGPAAPVILAAVNSAPSIVQRWLKERTHHG